MDIAKYIGLFLLKNNFVYLHGLGNLELKKKPAGYEGEALHSPQYDVVLTPGGSIDDTLANFIATHEQTSISKAANSLREFSTATRAELAAGKDVEIPGIGSFTETNGIIRFQANPHLKHVPPPVPTLRMSKRLEEAPDFRRGTPSNATDNEDGTAMSGSRIAILAGLFLIVVLGGYFGYKYLNTPKEEPVAQTAEVQPSTDPATPVVPSIDTVAPAPLVTDNDYVVVLNTYPSRTAAEHRANKLMQNGNQVEVQSADSTTFLVTLRAKMAPADSTRVLDSLRRFFNPKGVYILR